MDIDISDQKKIQNMGHALQKNFGGILKVSPRIFTKDFSTSRDVYRVNVFYEAPKYKKGDVVKIGKKLIAVTSSRDNLSGFDVASGKKVTVDMKNKEYSVLEQYESTVSKTHPHIEIIDPESYQSVPVKNHREVKIDEKVRIINDGGLFCIV